jgi:hypothetical protein
MGSANREFSFSEENGEGMVHNAHQVTTYRIHFLYTYLFSMNGTDRMDQLMESKSVRWQSNRWPMGIGVLR